MSQNTPSVRNVTYNPSWAMDVLRTICNDQAEDGYALLRVVPVHQYEAVAVFERRADPEDDLEGTTNDRNDRRNKLAAAVKSLRGDEFVPLSVRHEAAEAALVVLEAWEAQE